MSNGLYSVKLCGNHSKAQTKPMYYQRALPSVGDVIEVQVTLRARVVRVRRQPGWPGVPESHIVEALELSEPGDEQINDAGERGGRQYPGPVQCRRRMEPVDALVARRIRARRLELALSEEDAAREIGFSRARLRAIETGVLRPSAGETVSIASVLRISLGTLITGASADAPECDPASENLAKVTGERHVREFRAPDEVAPARSKRPSLLPPPL